MWRKEKRKVEGGYVYVGKLHVTLLLFPFCSITSICASGIAVCRYPILLFMALPIFCLSLGAGVAHVTGVLAVWAIIDDMYG